MDRRIVNTGALGETSEILGGQLEAMKGIGKLAEAILGTNSAISGLNCIPSVPAALTVQVTPGQLYALETIDSVAFSDLGTDTHPLIKQGVLWDSQTLALAPPSTSGQSINYLIQVTFLEVDTNFQTLQYFNPLSLTDPTAQPWTGPNNSGSQDPTLRQSTVQISAKPGTAATTGTQTTPAPDAGYVGLWVVTVSNGQTQITSGSIAKVVGAPFISPNLQNVPAWVQAGSANFASDTGSANAIVASLSPAPPALSPGMSVYVKKVASANTGAMTFNLNGTGPLAVLNADGSAIASAEVGASYLMHLVLDAGGGAWRFLNGATTTAVGSLTANSGEGITVGGGAVVSLNYPGLTTENNFGVSDIWSFFSQADGHHRGVSWGTMLAAIKAITLSFAPQTTFYVNFATGSDTTGDGLTAGTPWATVQHAIDKISHTYISFSTVTIQLAGNYTAGVGEVVGQFSASSIASWQVIGNPSTPNSVAINASALGARGFVSYGQVVTFSGMQITSYYEAISANYANIIVQYMNFVGIGSTSSVMASYNSSFISVRGNIGITGAFNAAFVSAQGSMIQIGYHDVVTATYVTITHTGTPSFATAYAVTISGYIVLDPYTASLTGAATGARYNCNLNGTINVNGAGYNVFPGNASGSLNNGGQYAP